MRFSTKWLQIMFRCIRLISGKAALSHHCSQTGGVNNTPAEADSCKVVISLRNPWVRPRSAVSKEDIYTPAHTYTLIRHPPGQRLTDDISTSDETSLKYRLT
jgi:hypothetical protein